MRLHPEADHPRAGAALGYLEPLRRHGATVSGLFPGLGASSPENGSISSADALFLGYLLGLHPAVRTVLELGPGTGASTLCLASHPKVSKVVSVNPNPPLPGEKTSEHPGTLDVARAVVGEYPEQRSKIRLFEGSTNEIPAAAQDELGDDDALVVTVGLRTRVGVTRCLTAAFDGRRNSVVILGGGRGETGPLVQAGAIDFLDGAEEEYRLRMAGDLGPALAASGLGIVYPSRIAAETEEMLGEVGRTFNLDLDPLKLLSRAEELNEAVGELGRQRDDLARQISRFNEEAAERVSGLEERVADLDGRNRALETRLAGRRYKAADAAADRLLRLPLVKRLLTGSSPPDGS